MRYSENQLIYKFSAFKSNQAKTKEGRVVYPSSFNFRLAYGR